MKKFGVKKSQDRTHENLRHIVKALDTQTSPSSMNLTDHQVSLFSKDTFKDEAVWRTLKKRNPQSTSEKVRRIKIESTTGEILGGDVPKAMVGKKVDDKVAWSKLSQGTKERTQPQRRPHPSNPSALEGEASPDEAPKRAKQGKGSAQAGSAVSRAQPPQIKRDLPAFEPKRQMSRPSVLDWSQHLSMGLASVRTELNGLNVKKLPPLKETLNRHTTLMHSVKLITDSTYSNLLSGNHLTEQAKRLVTEWTVNQNFHHSMEGFNDPKLLEAFEASGLANLYFNGITAIAADQLDGNAIGQVEDVIMRVRDQYNRVAARLADCTLVFAQKVTEALVKNPPSLKPEVIAKIERFLPKKALYEGLDQMPTGLKEVAIHVLNHVKFEETHKGSQYIRGTIQLKTSNAPIIPPKITFFHELGHAIDSFLCGGGLPSLGAISGLVTSIEEELDATYRKKGHTPFMEVAKGLLEKKNGKTVFDPESFKRDENEWLELLILGMTGRTKEEKTADLLLNTFSNLVNEFPNEIVDEETFEKRMCSKAKTFERLIVLSDTVEALPALPEETSSRFAGCASSHLITDYASGVMASFGKDVRTNTLNSSRFYNVTHNIRFWQGVPNEAIGKVRAGSEMVAQFISSVACDPEGTQALCRQFPNSLGQLFKILEANKTMEL